MLLAVSYLYTSLYCPIIVDFINIIQSELKSVLIEKEGIYQIYQSNSLSFKYLTNITIIHLFEWNEFI